MEFLVEFEVTVPKGTPEREVKERDTAESGAAAGLARQGHLLRLWRAADAPGKTNAVGVYRADSRAELDTLLSALPISEWMQVIVKPLRPHPDGLGVTSACVLRSAEATDPRPVSHVREGRLAVDV